METPSSNRRVTRSQTAASNSKNLPTSRKLEDSDLRQRTNGKQQQERSALIDITNDSPIVGVAAGNSLRTPSSSIANKRNNRAKGTPGSGEALLRGQVKILLQKVEEEAVLSRISMGNRPLLRLQGLVNSPMGLLAPTPANTPQVLSLSDDGSMNNGLVSSTALVDVEERLISQQVASGIFDEKEQENLESQKSIITRSLLLDFSEKSELSDSSECSSVLTCLGGPEGESGYKEKSSTTDDDNASVWSMQVHASAHGEDEDDEDAFIEGEGEGEEEEEDEYEEEDGSLVDELCQGVSKMWVNTEKKMPNFAGSHTRFLYNSDDEIVGEEEEGSGGKGDVSLSVVRLKGLPIPSGKHTRFAEAGNAD
ncbi:uncharacterized protein J3R85_008971 [Psidium guajava]|nr:uncharacterized protein J3R85_008971 [Psidium guajava]